MKVILTEDVKSLGKAGDVVDVSDGYARNFILAQKKGLEATSANLNSLKLKKANDDKLAKERLDEAKKLAEDLKSKTIRVGIRQGEGGKAFGSVSGKEIVTAAKEQHGLELDKKKIVLKDPIKAAGEYSVAIRLHPQVQGELKVIVSEE